MTAEICKEFLITKSKLLKNYYFFLYLNAAPITLRALFVAYLFLFNKDIQLNNFVLIFAHLASIFARKDLLSNFKWKYATLL